MIPSLGTDSEFCGRLCGAASTPDRPLIVLDCDYRKSPEHPFPAALEDVEDAVRFVLDYSVPVKDDVEVDLDDEYGFGDVEFDEKRISVSGFSAGGNLALSISSSGSPTVPRPDASGSTKQSPFRAVCAFYASPDLSKPHVAPSKSFDGGLVVPAILRAFFYKCLLAGGRPAPTPSGGGPAVEQTKDPRLSVTFSDTANFPRHVYLACGQADSLHDPGQALVGRLVKEGHPDATFTSVERWARFLTFLSFLGERRRSDSGWPGQGGARVRQERQGRVGDGAAKVEGVRRGDRDDQTGERGRCIERVS